MENVQVGDIVGWEFNVFCYQSEKVERRGEVIAICGDHICIKAFDVVSLCNPFTTRFRYHCHIVERKSEEVAKAA